VLIKPLGTLEEDELWLVDGAAVRALYDHNFTQGGHHHRYRWIPRRHIWIDDAVVESERSHVIAHEIHELELMRTGMSYYDAHDRALALEKWLRTSALKKRSRAA
jgi:hypothetical protein